MTRESAFAVHERSLREGIDGSTYHIISYVSYHVIITFLQLQNTE